MPPPVRVWRSEAARPVASSAGAGATPKADSQRTTEAARDRVSTCFMASLPSSRLVTVCRAAVRLRKIPMMIQLLPAGMPARPVAGLPSVGRQAERPRTEAREETAAGTFGPHDPAEGTFHRPGATASHAASSQPWNTTASPTCRTDGAKRRSPSSAR